MGNETRWLIGASAILPMGSMREQSPQTMARLRPSVSGSADVRSREGKGNRLTGPSIFERIRCRWGVLDPWEVAVMYEAPRHTPLVFPVELKATEELADTYSRG